MNPKRVTIPDIARELGLSVGTVSNALNANHGQVSAATILRVEAAAERLGYRRNRAAKTLRTGQHGAISLFVPSSVKSLHFYMSFTMGVAEAATQAKVDLLLVTSPPTARSTVHVDGALVIDWLPEISAADLSYGNNVPLFSAGDVPPGNEHVPSLAVDYYGQTVGIIRAAQASGAKRPVMIAPDSAFDSAWARTTKAAFLDATNGAPIHPISVDSTYSEVIAHCEDVQARHDPDFVLFGPQRFAGIASLSRAWGRPDSVVPWIASTAGDPVTELGSEFVTAIGANPHDFGIRAGGALLTLAHHRRLAPDNTTEAPIEPLHAVQPSAIHWAHHWEHELLE